LVPERGEAREGLAVLVERRVLPDHEDGEAHLVAAREGFEQLRQRLEVGRVRLPSRVAVNLHVRPEVVEVEPQAQQGLAGAHFSTPVPGAGARGAAGAPEAAVVEGPAAGAMPVPPLHLSTASSRSSPRWLQMVRAIFILDSPNRRDSSVFGYSTMRPPASLSRMRISATPRKPP